MIRLCASVCNVFTLSEPWWLLVVSLSPTDLSTDMVIETRGWSLSLAHLYSHPEKMWCPSLMGVGLLTSAVGRLSSATAPTASARAC